MKQSLLTAGISSLILGSAFAASSYNFESEASNDFFTGGVTGWTQSTTNPEISGVVVPLAYISSLDLGTGSGSSLVGFVGTRRTNLASAATTTLIGDLSGSGSMSGGTLSLNFGIIDTVATTVKDDFGFNIVDSSSATVASVFLIASPGNPTIWNIGYSVDGGALVTTASTVASNSGYALFVSFLDGNIRITYGTAADGIGTNLIADVSTSAAAGALYGSLEIFHDPSSTGAPDESRNALVFDNIVATTIPEPTSALLLGVASLGLLRRRRA